jgi:short-subunit dehydrogenase
MTFSLHGCRALITGASSGLGAEFARQLAPQATALLLVARRPEALEAVRADCLARNPEMRVEICTADLADSDGRETLRARVAGGDWNLLVNNAGMGDYGPVATADPAKLRLMLDLNVTAPVLLVNTLLPLLARPAAILNVSSLAGEVPLPEAACYAASKAFVTRFSEALRLELAGQGVSVSCLCPGPTPTAFSRTARRPDGGDTDRSGQDLLRQPPERVVAAGLRALATDRACVYPGTGVALAAWLFRHLPRALLRRLLQRRLERGRLGDTPAP